MKTSDEPPVGYPMMKYILNISRGLKFTQQKSIPSGEWSENILLLFVWVFSLKSVEYIQSTESLKKSKSRKKSETLL